MDKCPDPVTDTLTHSRNFLSQNRELKHKCLFSFRIVFEENRKKPTVYLKIFDFS